MEGTCGFSRSFCTLCDSFDGIALYHLLESTKKSSLPTESDKEASSDDVAANIIAAWSAGGTAQGLEFALTALQKWSNRYLERNAKVRWMLAPMQWLAARTRQLSLKLDSDSDLRRSRERVVEVLRQIFTKLQRDKDRREGALVISCELLRLYSNLGQASQCAFVLTSVGTAYSGNTCDPVKLPKSLLVTLYFLWGKHLVMAGKVEEAEEKLSKALSMCPLKAAKNRRLILVYLIPCRLRLGSYPSRGLLERNGLQSLAGIVAATASGNVRRFNEELLEKEQKLIAYGTYMVMEKLRVVAYRNLVQRVFSFQSERLDAAERSKQDMRPFEHALNWQETFSPKETMCLLSQLIYVGAVRGYMSFSHQKLVFSKEMPFPPVRAWSTKT